MIGRRDAVSGRHIDDGDAGIAGDMLWHVARNRARIEVIAASRRGPDNELDRLAAIKILRCGRRNDRERKKERKKEYKEHKKC